MTKYATKIIKIRHSFTMDLTALFRPVIPMIIAISAAGIVKNTGFSGLLQYARLIGASAVGLPLCFVVSGLLILVIGRLSPLPYIRKAAAFRVLPFSLANSSACLPDVITFCRDKLGMDESFTKFAIPAGMQINMDGTAFYVCVTSMMLARTFNLPMDNDFIVSLFFVEYFMALTGMGLIVMGPVLSAMGIPESAVTLFIGIEPVMDMFGTAQSVLGNITSAFICAGDDEELNKDVYHAY